MLSLQISDTNNFEDIYKDMLLQFPQNELKTFEVFFKLLSDKTLNYKLLLAKDNEKVIGYCLLYFDNEQNTIWIEYIAIYKEFHSFGYGSKIFETLKNTYKDYLGVYLEVEKANEDNINTLRRIKFYTRLGAKKIDCVYFYPNKEGCLEMDLYFIPFKEKMPDNQSIKTAIENIFSNLHSEIAHRNDVLKQIVI